MKEINTPNQQDGAAIPETADIETSSDRYALRFSGPAGEWLLRVQTDIVMDFMRDAPSDTVLDVGGGHGQVAIPLCNAGHRVTVLGSDPSCRHRVSGIVDKGSCVFKVGNLIDLPFPDRSFDTVVCFRLLTHCRQWHTLVRELCRVSRRAVIADYPTSQSVNRVAPALFGAKKQIEKDTRHWSLFRHSEVEDAFASNGYRLFRRRAQFFVPMVLHRAIKCPRVSIPLESVCSAMGLTARWGSPVIVEMRPDGAGRLRR